MQSETTQKIEVLNSKTEIQEAKSMAQKNTVQNSLAPKNQGLYNSANEKDACGVGFVAHIKGKKATKLYKKVWSYSPI